MQERIDLQELSHMPLKQNLKQSRCILQPTQADRSTYNVEKPEVNWLHARLEWPVSTHTTENCMVTQENKQTKELNLKVYKWLNLQEITVSARDINSRRKPAPFS